MKRFVILRDEAQLLAELSREAEPPIEPVVQAEPAAPPVAAGEPVSATAAYRRPRRPRPQATARRPCRAPRRGKLPDLARAAAISAEREAIQHALDHFRWNRRKAAAQLGVSYKTLLNKMKECGITTPAEDADGR